MTELRSPNSAQLQAADCPVPIDTRASHVKAPFEIAVLPFSELQPQAADGPVPVDPPADGPAAGPLHMKAKASGICILAWNGGKLILSEAKAHQ